MLWSGCVAALACVTSIFVGPVEATEPLRTIPFVAKAGDTFAVAIVVEDRRLRDTALDSHVTRTSRYDGSVVAVTPAGYRIAWTLKSFDTRINSDASGRQGIVLGAVRAANAAFMNRQIVFETDKSGSPTRVVDWEQLKPAFAAAMRSAIEDVITKAVTEHSPNLAADVVATIAKQQGERIVDTMINRRDERAAVDLFQEAVTLAVVQGTTLAVGQPIDYKDKTTGALTDAAVTRSTTLTLRERDEGQGRARITWTASFDEAALKASAAEAIRAQLQAAIATITDSGLKAEVAQRFDEQIQSVAVTRSDSGEGSVDLTSGWTRRLTQQAQIRTTQQGEPTDVRERIVSITVDPATR